MKKGKTLTVLVLVLEITTIAVLHVVKLNQSERVTAKEITRNTLPEAADSKPKPTYSLAVFR